MYSNSRSPIVDFDENIILRLRKKYYIPLPIRNVCYKNCGYIVLFVMQNSNCTEILNTCIYFIMKMCVLS